MNYVRSNFLGGINQRLDPTKVNPTSDFYLIVNGRTRRNRIAPIKQPLNITAGLPSGKVQGLYAFNTYLVAVVAGHVYAQQFVAGITPRWTRIDGATFSTTADRVYIEPVPASSINMQRVTPYTGNQQISLQGTAAPSPAAGVIMDGVSQPGLLFPNGTLRQAGTYASWTAAMPEYIPIGTIPMCVGNVLYCAIQDPTTKLFNQIARSVSGQPANFVIAVDVNGNKTDPTEAIGGAPKLQYNVDMNPLTSLKRLPAATPGAFIATTAGATYIVTPNFSGPMPFAEPTFANQFMFSTGPLNNDSIVNMLLGDTGLVSPFGVTTFNAVASTGFVGKNSIFSAPVDDILSGVTQSITAAVQYNTYAVFAVNTRYGPGVLWYDMMSQNWASFDILDGVGLIKQFAVQQTLTGFNLFMIDSNNQVFQYFGGGYTSATRVYFPEVVALDRETQEPLHHRIVKVTAAFTQGTSQTVVDASITSDRRYCGTKSVIIAPQMRTDMADSPIMPLEEPLTGERDTNSAMWTFEEMSKHGVRAGLELAWRGSAELLMVGVSTKEAALSLSDTNMPAVKTVSPIVMCFTGNQNNSGAAKQQIATVMQQEVGLSAIFDLGNCTTNSGPTIAADFATYITPLYSTLLDPTQLKRLYGISGTKEVSQSNAAGLYQIYREFPGHYGVVNFGNVDVYLLNAGFDVNGTQQEPDNLNGASVAVSTQLTWLTAQIATRKTAINLVLWSYPVWSSMYGNTTPALAGQAYPWLANGVSALICGEAPGFEHLNVSDLNTFVCGGSAGTIVAPTHTDPNSINIVSQPGYLKATIYQLSIVWEYKSPQGITLYTMRQAIE